MQKNKQRLRWSHLLWLLVPVLLWWVFKNVPAGDIWSTLKTLTAFQIGTLLVLNIFVMLTFSGRWWFALRGQGYHVPYLQLAGYRLTSFGISYFTPGPQFGGEPYQVYILKQRHAVPGTVSTAAVGLDKLLELVINFAFIATGIALTVQMQIAERIALYQALGAALMLLALPMGYLLVLWRGQTPLTWVFGKAAALFKRGDAIATLQQALADSERQVAVVVQKQPVTLVYATLISLVSWVGQMLEYWLALYFLGLALSPLELVSVMTAAYTAFLTPLPGGLGALEAGQVLIMETLGFDPTLGLGLTLIIRTRDVLFGLTGLVLGGLLMNSWKTVFRGDSKHEDKI